MGESIEIGGNFMRYATNPDTARKAYARGYRDYKNGVDWADNPYRPTRSRNNRHDMWHLGWVDAKKGKPSQENDIDYEWLIS